MSVRKVAGLNSLDSTANTVGSVMSTILDCGAMAGGRMPVIVSTGPDARNDCAKGGVVCLLVSAAAVDEEDDNAAEDDEDDDAAAVGRESSASAAASSSSEPNKSASSMEANTRPGADTAWGDAVVMGTSLDGADAEDGTAEGAAAPLPVSSSESLPNNASSTRCSSALEMSERSAAGRCIKGSSYGTCRQQRDTM